MSTLLGRTLPARVLVFLGAVAVLVTVDRAGAIFAAGLTPGASPDVLPGGWLAVQRLDHLATGGPAMLAFGAMLLAIALIAAYLPDDVPALRLMLASSACTVAGVLANGIAVIVSGRAMDFLVAHDPAWLIRLAAVYNGAPPPAAPVVHFVPADLWIWSGFALWTAWAVSTLGGVLLGRLQAIALATIGRA